LKKYAVRLVILVVIIAGIFAIFRFTPVGEFLKPANLEANKEALFENVAEHYGLAVLLYILLYVAVVALSIPGATVLTLLGGFFFGGISGLAGVGLGTLYVNIGATGGAFLVFLAARFFLGDMVHDKYGPKLEKFSKELDENGKNYLLTMRFIPIFPFWMINLLAGVAKVNPLTFVWTTSLGIIPGSLVYTYVGYAFGSVGGEAQTVIRNVVIALVALAVISLVPVVLKKIRARRTGDEPQDTQAGTGETEKNS
jgi:uncharacterized membrane protein YdjX (TVP38/TMEM64 family)